jgi:hypothetical protein
MAADGTASQATIGTRKRAYSSKFRQTHISVKVPDNAYAEDSPLGQDGDAIVVTSRQIVAIS